MTGIFAASYGGHMTAGLDTWRPTNADEWMALAPFDLPNPLLEIDLNWWTLEGLPDLGGSAFYYPGEPDITGFRMKPPPLDPHQYHAEKKKKKVTVIDPNATAIPDPPAEEERPRSRRRTDRSKSATGYVELRRDLAEPLESRGQHRSQERRGRSRKPHYLR